MSSYNRIAAVTKALQILRFLADQKKPVSGKEVASAMGMAHGTVMCHLATMEDERFVRKAGEHFELGQEAGLLWARRKSSLAANITRSHGELNELGD